MLNAVWRRQCSNHLPSLSLSLSFLLASYSRPAFYLTLQHFLPLAKISGFGDFDEDDEEDEDDEDDAEEEIDLENEEPAKKKKKTQ